MIILFRKRYKHYAGEYLDQWLYLLFLGVVAVPNQKKLSWENFCFYRLPVDENLKPKSIKVIWGGYKAKNTNRQIKKPSNLEAPRFLNLSICIFYIQQFLLNYTTSKWNFASNLWKIKLLWDKNGWLEYFYHLRNFWRLLRIRWTLNQPRKVTAIMQLKCLFTLIPFSYLLQLSESFLKGESAKKPLSTVF